MALNIKLRATASLVQVADDVGTNGDFTQIANRFYYAYINKFGEGVIRFSNDGGYTWQVYDQLGRIDNIAARGNLVAWSSGKRGIIYDINQQWTVADGTPFDPEGMGSIGEIVPLPEIGAVLFFRTTTGSNSFYSIKSLSNFGIWDADVSSVSTGSGGFQTTQRHFLGVYGDRITQGGGSSKVYDAYLIEPYLFFSPLAPYVIYYPRSGVSTPSSQEIPYIVGQYLVSGFGTRGMEATPDGVSGIVGSGVRKGSHNTVVSDAFWSARIDGIQIGLRFFTDVRGAQNFEWAHGSAWVDEFNVTSAQGAIGGTRGLIFTDSAGNVVMVKRSGSQFGAWSEAKSYGNPGFAPTSLWLPNAYADVRAGLYGGSEAWFLIDTTPNFIPRGRLVAGDYIANDAPENKLQSSFRKVTFW